MAVHKIDAIPPANGQTVIDNRRVDRLGEVYDVAIDIVRRRLNGESMQADQVELARIMVAQWAKVRQTDNARAALDFMMSRALAGSPDELRRLVQVTMPRTLISGSIESPPANGHEN